MNSNLSTDHGYQQKKIYWNETMEHKPWEEEELRDLYERACVGTSCPTCFGRGVFSVPTEETARFYPCFACEAFGRRSENVAAIRYVETIRAAQKIKDSDPIIVKTKEGRLNFHADRLSPPRTLRAVLRDLGFDSQIFDDLAQSGTVSNQKLEKLLFQEDREEI